MRAFFRNKIVFALLLFSSTLMGQSETILDYFNASETNKQVFLKWAISSGETCEGIKITRSSDMIIFATIGEIGGVCGSPDTPVPYSFVDESPLLNQKSYYRLELGTSDFSEIITLELVDTQSEGYQVRPQPIKNHGKIFFDNPNFENWEFQLFNLNGKILFQQSTKDDFIDLVTEKWPSGIYFFRLSSSNQIIRGKIIVSK